VNHSITLERNVLREILAKALNVQGFRSIRIKIAQIVSRRNSGIFGVSTGSETFQN
jgi:hypothetical protein